LTALLEYLDLLTHVAESGQANAGTAGPWAPALEGDVVVMNVALLYQFKFFLNLLSVKLDRRTVNNTGRLKLKDHMVFHLQP